MSCERRTRLPPRYSPARVLSLRGESLQHGLRGEVSRLAEIRPVKGCADAYSHAAPLEAFPRSLPLDCAGGCTAGRTVSSEAFADHRCGCYRLIPQQHMSEIIGADVPPDAMHTSCELYR